MTSYISLMPTGAVYQAARLSKGFRVKNFVVKDASVYPIEVRKIVRYFVCPL